MLEKKFCQRHKDHFGELGWIWEGDRITVVPESECQAAECKAKRERERRQSSTL